MIVPVYDTGLYLPQCIDSLLAQTYTDFELILVDDGSPDDSRSIIGKYAAKDDRIRPVYKSNGGVSSARNAGLDICQGSFVVFCDSDDYAHEDLLQALLENYRHSGDPATWVISNYTRLFPNGDLHTYPLADGTVTLDEGELDDFRHVADNYMAYSPWGKLYRRDIIEKQALRFDTHLRSAEDLDFNIRYLRSIRYIRFISDSRYFYRICYKPVSLKPIDDSAIASAHLICGALTEIARRMGIRQEAGPYIARQVAHKHWLDRIPSVFCSSSGMKAPQRKAMYKKLKGDKEYRSLCKAGIDQLSVSGYLRLMAKIDNYTLWCCFFWMHRILKGR